MDFQDIKRALTQRINMYKIKNPSVQDSDFKYKRCCKHLILLFIPDNVRTNQSRKDVVQLFAKFRAEKAYCVAILNVDDCHFTMSYEHESLVSIVYTAGEWIYPDAFDSDVEKIATTGIHYYCSLLPAYFMAITVKKSLCYNLMIQD